MLPTKPMSKDKMSGEGWGQHLLRLGREEDSRGAPAKGGHQTKLTTPKTTAIVRRNERGLLFATIKASFETSHSRRDEQACLLVYLFDIWGAQKQKMWPQINQ